MDMVFSTPVHQDPVLVVEIIDDGWAAEVLPIEEVETPPGVTNNVDDDPSGQQEEDDQNKWNDLGLEELDKLSSTDEPADKPNPTPSSRPAPSR